ncbi:MAG: GNAT family N-acetyltransferase [Myxococcota bacterium]|jgi:GNAT superfamily N-acetyltransferase|nr:GNAT family N-acetyltransferase [Myxococcota bacterium]
MIAEGGGRGPNARDRLAASGGSHVGDTIEHHKVAVDTNVGCQYISTGGSHVHWDVGIAGEFLGFGLDLLYVGNDIDSRADTDDVPEAMRNEVNPAAGYEAAARAERVIVAVHPERDEPVGFAWCSEDAQVTHLEELDVHPDHGRQGLGSRFLRAVLKHASERGDRAVTLTTFRHLPWNAPFYVRHGFRIVEGTALGEDLAAWLEAEAEEGLDPATRVAMRCDFDRDATATDRHQS